MRGRAHAQTHAHTHTPTHTTSRSSSSNTTLTQRCPHGLLLQLHLPPPTTHTRHTQVTPEGRFLSKGAARIQVDAVPSLTGDAPAVAVNYHRENAAFMVSPVSPVPPAP